MKNIELQKLLANHPDDYEVRMSCVDSIFPDCPDAIGEKIDLRNYGGRKILVLNGVPF